MEVVIRRGAGEEKYGSLVRENGSVSVGFMEVNVGGITVAEAERRLQEAARPFMREPLAQIVLKKKLLKIKRVFVFGERQETRDGSHVEKYDGSAGPRRSR